MTARQKVLREPSNVKVKPATALPELEARDGAIIAKAQQVLIASAAGRCHKPMVISNEARYLTEEITRRANAYPKLVEALQETVRCFEQPGRDLPIRTMRALLRELGEES